MEKIFAKTLLLKDNYLNIYRGCNHDCIYCDSRSNCYHIDNFSVVKEKVNFLEVLEKECQNKQNIVLKIGSASDPYNPCELKYEYTKKLLDFCLKNSFGIALLTKSLLIERDYDLLKKLDDETKVIVMMTITTYDEKLRQKIEPCSKTSERFRVLENFHKLGIETAIWITPLLPYINDDLQNLKNILNKANEIKVKNIFMWSPAVTLRPGSREYFYNNLDRYFPGLKVKYISKYYYRYNCVSENSVKLINYFQKFCLANNINTDLNKMYNKAKQIVTKKNARNDYNLFNLDIYEKEY